LDPHDPVVSKHEDFSREQIEKWKEIRIAINDSKAGFYETFESLFHNPISGHERFLAFESMGYAAFLRSLRKENFRWVDLVQRT
jgi:hypothetical protein